MTELYKKHRPKELDEIVGQKEAVETLQNYIDKENLPHAILFTGSSGVGKTTLARILKQHLNCSDNDFNEINCADLTGVDTIRDIRKQIGYAPVGGDSRIWLVDEYHMASKGSQNAILKMLEDTPKHVYFFLATTDPQKILKTIKTRCTEINLKELTDSQLKKLIKSVCKKEKKKLDKEVIAHIIENSLGSARMALVLLDKVIDLDEDSQIKAIEAHSDKEKQSIELCRSLIKGSSWKTIAAILKELVDEPESVRYAVLGYARSVLLNSGSGKAADIIDEFADNFYDSKKAGLALACYNVVNG